MLYVRTLSTNQVNIAEACGANKDALSESIVRLHSIHRATRAWECSGCATYGINPLVRKMPRMSLREDNGSSGQEKKITTRKRE